MNPISMRKPQANAIVERLHQTIGNILQTLEVQKMELDENDPWSGVLSTTMFAVLSTIHTTLQATPMQLVFGHDAILNIQHEANWKLISDRKQKLINKTNKR